MRSWGSINDNRSNNELVSGISDVINFKEQELMFRMLRPMTSLVKDPPLIGSNSTDLLLLHLLSFGAENFKNVTE